MNRVNPSTLFFFFVVLALGGMFDFPVLIFAFIIYMIFKSRKGNNNPRNPNQRHQNRRQRDYDRRRRYNTDYDRKPQRESEYRAPQRRTPSTRTAPKSNPFKTSGLKKYKDYEYEGAIEDFLKALQINSNDIAVHFNLACAYSLTEQKEKSLEHLSKAIALGFNDFDKIKEHDALAYVRIQDEFEPFVKSGYKWPLSQQTENAEPENILENDNLLEQLKKLGELRDKGLLTEEEFTLQKKKLLE